MGIQIRTATGSKFTQTIVRGRIALFRDNTNGYPDLRLISIQATVPTVTPPREDSLGNSLSAASAVRYG